MTAPEKRRFPITLRALQVTAVTELSPRLRRVTLSGPQLAAFRTYTSNALARIRTVEDIIYADVGPAEEAAKPATAVATAKPATGKKNGKG